MSTVLSIVYHLEVVQLDVFQLVLVGTVQETSCFLFEIPTGVVADLYSRRRSVLIGMFLYGLGFLMEGAAARSGDWTAAGATAAPARNGRHGAVKEACPEGLKISFGQAIITTENRELLY